MLTETRYEYIVLGDEHPTLAGTTMKVKELIAERLAWGWSAEELLINHPDLTLGKHLESEVLQIEHSACCVGIHDKPSKGQQVVKQAHLQTS